MAGQWTTCLIHSGSLLCFAQANLTVNITQYESALYVMDVLECKMKTEQFRSGFASIQIKYKYKVHIWLWEDWDGKGLHAGSYTHHGQEQT